MDDNNEHMFINNFIVSKFHKALVKALRQINRLRRALGIWEIVTKLLQTMI